MANTPSSNGDRRRKAHSKSRNGCHQCKAKHYKCDEVHPKCGSCTRNNLSCSLADPKSTPALHQPLALEDLRLLYHWLKPGEDFMPFGDHEKVDAEAEDDAMMSLAFCRPYLLRMIVALSALHLVHRNISNIDLYQQASAHYAAALNQARPHLLSKDDGHTKAVFRFSGFVSLYAFAEPPLRPHLNQPDRIVNALVESFRASRGVRAVLHKNADVLTSSGTLEPSRYADNGSSVENTLDQDFPQMSDLLSLCQEQVRSTEDITAWEAGLRELFISIGVLLSNPVNHSSLRRIMTWHMNLDDRCLHMMQAQHPIALITLGYYAALLQLRKNYWFCTRWPPILLSAVENLLDVQWHSFLRWPREMISTPPGD